MRKCRRRRYRVYHSGRPMILLATAPPWSLERGAEEIGDTLYAFDPGIHVKVVREYSVVLVFSKLDADDAFRFLGRTPPAYVSRILPVYYHGEPSSKEVVEAVDYMLDCIGGGAKIGLELRVRGNCARQDELYDNVYTVFPFLLEEGVGIDYLIRIEIVCPWLFAGFTPDRLDRVSRWRSRSSLTTS